MSTMTVSIAGTSYPVKEQSWDIADKIEEKSTCKFTIQDDNAAFSFKKGQLVTVTDTSQGVMFSGKIHTITRSLQTGTSASPVLHEIDCDNLYVVFEEKSSNKLYINQYAGAIFIDQIKDRWVDGITANYAVDTDDTQADFAQGTLVNTVATTNVEDGNLELAPAGATTTIIEKTTSVFNSGTLTNMSASGNTLGPSSTSAIKIQATQSVAGVSNSYTYVKIWAGTPIAIIASRYLEYDIWISSTSPEAKIGVDMIFSDGTSYRDLATSNNGLWFDAQNKSPHPGTDLKGLATDQWYHRKFLLDNFTSKTIVSVTIAIEGDSAGTYTGYIKNITETNGAGSIINTFFSGSLNVNPPQQMQKQGYQTTSVTVVNTYDCSTASRVSPSYSIDPVKILKSSFISYKTSLPTGYTFNLSYSIDGGNSYTPFTPAISDGSVVNNAALPYLLAGQSLGGKSIQFLQSFTQGAGADPTQKPTLTSMIATLYPSYAATKSDINGEWTTNSQWNAGTHTNTQAANNTLSPFGAVRNWDDGSLVGQTLYGGGATGPNNANSCFQYVDSKQFRMEVHQSTEARSRMDFAGQWGDFQAEFDVSVDNTLMKVGFFYRTTGSPNLSNFDGTTAYQIEIIGTTVKLFKGSNNPAAGANFAVTQVGSTATVALTSQAMHRVKVLVVGSSHKIYLDDVLVINATDATYTAAGYMGFRISNTDTVNGYIGTFDNFGVSITNPFSGANWTSQSVSLTSAGTYLNSIVQWDDVSTDPSQVANNLWVSYNGGSSWSICTNGAALPGLTAGQSLSGVSALFQMLFSYQTSTVLPQIQDLTLYVLGGFSSTGTRVSKALSLTPVGFCGTTLVFWNAITPAGTTITVATSLDGTTYTNVSNGGSIAGINQQPAPTIDSYNLLSSSNYINTARTGGVATAGWLWDTVNSRLSVSGGTNALLIYSSLSQKDVDVYFDIDQSDQSGLVWRRTDNSNFYELDIFDASSSAGSTNIMRLFKVVANVKTQIGADIPILLARGTVYRARVTMIGTAISIYFDGTLVRSTTDSSLVGPGTVGFVQVSGIARFYNLRIQPIGDDLTNKKVYTKITLTSTDPTVTPQVTDFTTLATNPNIQAGALIPIADYRNTYRSDNISDLAKKSDYLSDVRADGSAIFTARQTTPAPWVLTGNDTLIANLSVEDSADLYRNRHILKGVKDQLNVNETFIGNGTATSWPLQYNVVSASSITLNGQVATIGVKGVDNGKDFYYEVGSNSIAQDSAGTLLINTDSVKITYVGQFETTVTRDNTGQFAGTISQSDYRKQSGLSVPPQTLLNQTSAAQTVSGVSDDMDTTLCRTLALDINVTAMSGSASPSLQFFVERKDAFGNYYVIYQSNLITAVTTVVSRTIGKLGQTQEALGATCRVRWTITGTTPSFTFGISVQGQVDPGLAGIGIAEALEDVSDQNLTVAAAQALGDSRLQKYGLIGRTLKFGTRRTGLSAGQYLNCFVPQLGFNDAALLITSVDKTQKMLSSGNQDYWHSVEASESTNLPSWEKAMNDAAIK